MIFPASPRTSTIQHIGREYNGCQKKDLSEQADSGALFCATIAVYFLLYTFCWSYSMGIIGDWLILQQLVKKGFLMRFLCAHF
ncbi:MAG: hypothetical protein C4527_19120 [Candidatus Omnitrophota bacterium]|nr:MAG: hypothetical protein C4527_19120 [Candidatus Omnitrophota bacterium]